MLSPQALLPACPAAFVLRQVEFKTSQLFQEGIFFASHPTPEEVGFLSEFDKELALRLLQICSRILVDRTVFSALKEQS